MPSTGTAAFTVNRDALITSALRKLRVVVEGSTATAVQLSAGAEVLNIMLKSWAVDGLKLWCYQQVQVPMVANQPSYTIGPTGANVTAVRPLRVFEYGNFIRYTTGGVNYDTPLRLISRQEYLQLGAKGTAGVPNSIYYFPGIDVAGGLTSPSTGYGTLFVYVTASDTTRTVFLNAQRPLFDMTNATDEFDVPPEWFKAIRLNLAYELADEYEVEEQRILRLRVEAKDALEQCNAWSTEEASSSFTPDFSGR